MFYLYIIIILSIITVDIIITVGIIATIISYYLFLFFIFISHPSNPQLKTIINIIGFIFVHDMFLKFDKAAIILIIFINLNFKILIMDVVFKEPVILISIEFRRGGHSRIVIMMEILRVIWKLSICSWGITWSSRHDYNY